MCFPPGFLVDGNKRIRTHSNANVRPASIYMLLLQRRLLWLFVQTFTFYGQRRSVAVFTVGIGRGAGVVADVFGRNAFDGQHRDVGSEYLHVLGGGLPKHFSIVCPPEVEWFPSSDHGATDDGLLSQRYTLGEEERLDFWRICGMPIKKSVC